MEHPFLFAVSAFLMLMTLISWVGYRLIYKPGKFMRQLGRPVITSDRLLEQPLEAESSTVVTFLQGLGSKIPSSETEVQNLKADLIRAGYRSENALPVFYGLRIMVTLLMLVLCVMLEAHMPPNAVMKLGLMASGIGAGWVLPRFFLEKKVTKRQETLRLSLPDALDLMVVSIEAGLGLDQAIQRVADELGMVHPELSEELRLVNLELRAGTARADALRNLANRTQVDDLSSLVTMLVQTDKFGTSVAQSLRVHSDTSRTKRRQRAEEAAAKTGAKMVFPLVFCIFPAIWVVTIGPAAIKFVEVLVPLVQQQK